MARLDRIESGAANAVVFGRMVTFALQNMKHNEPGFDEWWAGKQAELKADPIMKFCNDHRTAIEKQAVAPVTRHVKSRFNGAVYASAHPKPPGATDLLIGDRDGLSFWIVPGPDGKSEKYYVDLLPGAVTMTPRFAQDSGLHHMTAVEVLTHYLDKLEAIVNEAEHKFIPGA